jgi:hypothetical protein
LDSFGVHQKLPNKLPNKLPDKLPEKVPEKLPHKLPHKHDEIAETIKRVVLALHGAMKRPINKLSEYLF